MILGASSRVIKQSEHEVGNVWSYNLILSYVFIAWCLIKLRNNCRFVNEIKTCSLCETVMGLYMLVRLCETVMGLYMLVRLCETVMGLYMLVRLCETVMGSVHVGAFM